MTEQVCKFHFTFESSYFVDYPETALACPQSKLETLPELGLLDRNYNDAETTPAWARFATHVRHLNDAAVTGVTYKVLFVVRHGRGVHNVVMEKEGSVEWKNHWSKLDGDGSRTWFDADLVDEGVEEAKTLSRLFADGIENRGFPLPDSIYTSPLSRCLATTKLAFKGILEDRGTLFKPKVKELLRERLTDHTCDRRRDKSWIQSVYPEYELEAGFAENDVLWHPDRYESDTEHMARTQQLLENIFDSESGTFLVLVTHSFTLSSILQVIGAPMFRVGEGVIVPFLVRSQKLHF
ncbi:histidine phosphatase superfamily [Stachybotrys elegans]|uniref:Histidine phosphatase superfamily n=1 Tax=Stachybotrys elegans TaxID=80388 RepID=A0A8K0WK82_9HYPO|nr:histidine phosphatase superfamily [Stachybotrys elegans]